MAETWQKGILAFGWGIWNIVSWGLDNNTPSATQHQQGGQLQSHLPSRVGPGAMAGLIS